MTARTQIRTESKERLTDSYRKTNRDDASWKTDVKKKRKRKKNEQTESIIFK